MNLSTMILLQDLRTREITDVNINPRNLGISYPHGVKIDLEAYLQDEWSIATISKLGFASSNNILHSHKVYTPEHEFTLGHYVLDEETYQSSLYSPPDPIS